MTVSSKRLEMFRDLKIRRSEIAESPRTDLFNAKIDTGKEVVICPEHLNTLLNKVKEEKISEEQLLEWVNTVIFTDLFEYCEEYQECIASILDELEEIDEEGKELNDEKIEKYLDALEKNIEL